MRHFNYLTEEYLKETFFKYPESFNKYTDRSLLAYALGAILYMPGNRLTIADDMISHKNPGLTSTVFCLEDSVGDLELVGAERNLGAQVSKIRYAVENGQVVADDLPLMFIRVRSAEQMLRVVGEMGDDARILTGFVFPKFTAKQMGVSYFEALKTLNQLPIGPFYGMPILESPEVIYRESRIQEMVAIKDLIDAHHDLVLNIRMGATDFSGLFGIRRGPDVTIYDIVTIRDCIADILNVFNRAENDYVVSGPVWEYFASVRVLKPQLRQRPFEESYGEAGGKIRSQLLNKYIDGLIHEVILDKENGIIGKTIIHPSHIAPVNALYAVGYEEYLDALSIVENSQGNVGVMKSQYTNKMNEVKPHFNWAKKTLRRAKIYGVFHEQHNFTSLLTE